jgi:hypothetical protein
LSEDNKQTTTTVTTPTANPQQDVAALFRDQLSGAVKSTGGLPTGLAFNQNALPSAGERQALSGIQSMNPGISPYEQEGLNTLKSLQNPAAQMQAAQGYFQDIAAPALLNQASASGVGARSGGATEALTRGARELALPIAQQAAQAGRDYAGANVAMGNILNQRGLTDYNAAYQAAGVPRLAQLNEQIRPLDAIIRLLGGAGAAPVGSTSIATTSNPQSATQTALGAGSILANALGSIRW